MTGYFQHAWIEDQERYDETGEQPDWRSANPRVPADWRLDLECVCFGNAEHLVALDPALAYQEGHARLPGGEWGEHAWAVTEDGVIVDPYFEWKFPEEKIEYDAKVAS